MRPYSAFYCAVLFIAKTVSDMSGLKRHGVSRDRKAEIIKAVGKSSSKSCQGSRRSV